MKMREDIRSYLFRPLQPKPLHLALIFSVFPLLLSLIFYPNRAYSDTSSRTRLEDIGVPKYTRSRPQWGVELTFSPRAFGETALTHEQQTNPIYAFSLAAEFQPAFLQSFGVFGIGPSLAMYPAFGSGITSGLLSLWGAGGQIRYQARYFREQPVVPIAAYSIEYFSYQFQSGMSGNLISQGPTLGLWVLLNFLEPSSAAQLYIEEGVSRSYLVAEYRLLTGRDSNLSFSGGSYYFGLRFEF